MRAGVFISGISHVVLVALALLGTPRLFDNPPLRAIEVDLVRPEEADLPKERPPEEKAAFKAHVKKCWKLPDGMTPAQTTRVVLRVFLKRDGNLAAEPLLIEASASRDGPVLLKAAIRTLKECQPYAFLPADKYREW